MDWGAVPGSNAIMSTLKSPFRRRTTSNEDLERAVPARARKSSSEDGAALYRAVRTAFSVRISRTETATKGDTHTVYVLEVSYNQNRWFVKKRYSEFRQLHQNLERDFGRVLLERARLPGKKMFGSLSVSVVEKRRLALQRYLNDLSKIQPSGKARTPSVFLTVAPLTAAHSARAPQTRRACAAARAKVRGS